MRNKLIYIENGNEIKLNDITEKLIENGIVLNIDYENEKVDIFDGKEGFEIKGDYLKQNGIKFV
jgi:hypothetical protein